MATRTMAVGRVCEGETRIRFGLKPEVAMQLALVMEPPLCVDQLSDDELEAFFDELLSKPGLGWPDEEE